jgi:Ni/Co efflux regulator RcnB
MRRLAFVLGVAAVMLAANIAAPAYANTQPNGKGNDARRPPASQQIADRDRDHGREQHHGGGNHGGYHGGGGYRGGGDVYYGPPPIVYAPPTYYQQPGVSLNFGLPIY